MELLDLEVRTRGRANAQITTTVVRELEAADINALATAPRGSQSVNIKRLRDRHHALARNLAQGLSERDAAIICGYDLSRVSILKSDPAFKELLEFYRDRQGEKFDDFAGKLATIAGEAANQLIEKLEDDDIDMTPAQLMQLVELGADRTGFGKQTRSDNLNLHVGLADGLSEARKRVAERRAKVIDAAD